MMKQRGYTIVELLLAIGLSALIVTSTSFLLSQVFTEHKNLEVWSVGQFEMSAALKNIEADLRNIVRFDPIEKGSQSYVGLTSIGAGGEPAECLNMTGAPVIRYTTLNRKTRSERVLRAWSEVDNAGQSGGKHELRLSADDSSESLFGAEGAPQEITIVDADRRYLRRYKVLSHILHLNSKKDPYSDLPMVDNFGNPMTFDYVSVFLDVPQGSRGEATKKQPSSFVTGSEAYASQTYFVCLRKKDKSLIKINQATNEVSVLFLNSQMDFEVDQLNIGYLGSRRSQRVEPANFKPEITGDLLDCVNTVLIELYLRTTSSYIARTRQNNVGEVQQKIVRRRAIFSPNLNMRRPTRCIDALSP